MDLVHPGRCAKRIGDWVDHLGLNSRTIKPEIGVFRLRAPIQGIARSVPEAWLTS